MRRTSIALFTLTFGLIFFSPPLGAAATHAPGSKCTKVGATTKSGKSLVKCVKSGKKLIWKKIAVAKATPPTTATPTPSAAPSKSTTGTAYEISVNASQWSWEFSYSKDGTKASLTGAPTDPPVLYLPQGKLVRFTVKSADVSHGFWIPGLMIDMKVAPNATTDHVEFTADKLGTYPGACHIICGREHSTMIFTVKVVTPAEYVTYLSTLKAS